MGDIANAKLDAAGSPMFSSPDRNVSRHQRQFGIDLDGVKCEPGSFYFLFGGCRPEPQKTPASQLKPGDQACALVSDLYFDVSEPGQFLLSTDLCDGRA
jgi:hypothetical protein